MIDKEEVLRIKEWLNSDCVDDPEDLFNKVPLLIELMDFWLEHNKDL